MCKITLGMLTVVLIVVGCKSVDVPYKSNLTERKLQVDLTGGKKVMAYFPEWGGIEGGYTVWDVPAEHLTHLFYAFAHLTEDGQVKVDMLSKGLEMVYPEGKGVQGVKGHLRQLIELKKKYPHLKTLISIGGWELSMHFSSLSVTAYGRETLAKNAVAFMHKYQFDGIDIDWEFPVKGSKYKDKQRPEDRENFTKLMQAIRDEMDFYEEEDDKEYLLTAAVTVSIYRQKHLELQKLSKLFDFVNVMVYDMHGRWIKDQTGHLSPMYPTKAIAGDENICGDIGLQGYLNAGFKPGQIMVGAPLYAAGWQGVDVKKEGVFQKAVGLAKGTSVHKGYYEWRYIAKELLEKQGNQYYLKMDEDAKAAYVWAPEVDGGTWITCPSRASYQAKIDYVKQYDLGGMFFWDVSNDVRDPESVQSLIRFTADGLMHSKSYK
ncbi:glycoside hydrolase family 18 protein [Poriferisphaera sp. WC338]|uniref:glycoside hydrolase family 18 protein n=1 Tax=Poriferisphaera sp. WC338 TaxID=3425129 RepID=UPI003D816068